MIRDYIIYHSSDDSYSFISKKIDELYHELSAREYQQFKEIDKIIEKSVTESEFILENQIKSLLEGQNDDIVKYVREYINLEIKLSKKFILDEDNC